MNSLNHLMRVGGMSVAALCCMMIVNSCRSKPAAVLEMTAEDVQYHQFACKYLRDVFDGKIPLSHPGIDKLRTYIQGHENDWGRIELLTDKSSENPNEVDVIVQDRVTKDLVVFYNVEVTKLEMKSGNLKIKNFTWYLK